MQRLVNEISSAGYGHCTDRPGAALKVSGHILSPHISICLCWLAWLQIFQFRFVPSHAFHGTDLHYFYIMHARFQLEPVFRFMLCIYVTEIDADIFALCFFPFRYFCLLFAVGRCFGYNAYPIDFIVLWCLFVTILPMPISENATVNAN